MPDAKASPAELRSMFGKNLRTLAERYPSISELSRQLGINRTQFNRYLAGESFPRPDVLARICAFFDVDARILLEPVAEIGDLDDTLGHPFLAGFVGGGARDVPEEVFPSGFYQFSRRSFMSEGDYVVGLVRVFRSGRTTMVNGFEAKEAMRAQGLSTDRTAREFRGLVMLQESGIAALISRNGGMTASFNYLSPEASFQNNYWTGYAIRTVREALDSDRAVRMVYEYLGTGWASARKAARGAGYTKYQDLLPYHQRLLRDGQPFR
ncbi:MAG: helix-turn-helix transcriptional regulator [Pseudomonadota bacterium]